MLDDRVHAEFLRYYELLEKFSADYRSDAALKARIDGGDIAPAVEALGLEDVQREVEVRIVSDTQEVRHVIMPPAAEQVVPDSLLEMVAGGTGASALETGRRFAQVNVAFGMMTITDGPDT